jgi:hypothetical protein
MAAASHAHCVEAVVMVSNDEDIDADARTCCIYVTLILATYGGDRHDLWFLSRPEISSSDGQGSKQHRWCADADRMK